MSTPLVSIIIPVSGDEPRVGDTLRSSASQSLSELEVICLCDPAANADAVDQLAARDPRVRVIRTPETTPTAEARRVGVLAAKAPHVLFLEPGDELDRHAAAKLYTRALESDADIVESDVADIMPDGRPNAAAQRDQQSGHRLLHDEDILRHLFPEAPSLDRDIWRYLFRTDLLHTVYTALPDSSAVQLKNDLPVVFLACAAARTFTTAGEALLRHRSGRTPHPVGSVVEFESTLDSIGSLSLIEPVVREWARNAPNPEPLVDGYESIRLATTARALELLQRLPAGARVQEAARLHAGVDPADLIGAAVTFAPAALQDMAQHADRLELGTKPVRSVLLTTNILTTGGVSGVLRTQAQLLLDAGYRVTIAAHRPGSDESAAPAGASLVQISGSKSQRVAQWADLCRRNEIEIVIDHRILYSRDWPAYALAARANGAATIGWIHNFAGRPTYNGNDLHSQLRGHLNALAHLIVLSPLDVAFWKLRGIRHVSYLPNPPSPLLLGSAGQLVPKTSPAGRRLELVWWGRLEEHTKKVTELVEAAAVLKRLGVDFRMRIVGPDWADMTADRLSALAAARGLDREVELTGPQHGEDLLEVIDSSDIFVNTSIIEGYPLTLPEAQSRGLPIAMFDLPWLALTQDNGGVTTVPQGDTDALAAAIVEIADPERYEAMSRASIDAARRATEYDFALLYQRLISGTLPAEFSPEPTLEDGRRALELLIFFAEKSAARPTGPSDAGARGSTPRASRRSLAGKVERRLTPLGHRVLDIAPWLHPAARRAKHALLRR